MVNKLQTRRTLIQTDDYHIEYETLNEDLFLHLEIFRWSVSAYKHYLRVWRHILSGLRSKGYEDVYCLIPYDEKIVKFEKMFGFKKLTDLNDGLLMIRSTQWV